MDILRDFIQNGYIEIDLSKLDFHKDVYDRICNFTIQWQDIEIIDHVPELENYIYTHPSVVEVLNVILGKNYVRHPHVGLFDGNIYANKTPHRDYHLHLSRDFVVSQPWYLNIWNRRPRCRYVQLFYCPYLEKISTSGTGFYPGSQYYDDEMTMDLDVEPCRLRSMGKIIIAHGELYHRSYLKNDDIRYIIKSIFLRTVNPYQNGNCDKKIWNLNMHDSKVFNYHFNWYTSNNKNISNCLYDDVIVDFEFKETNRERTLAFYSMSEVTDYQRCIDNIDLLQSKKSIKLLNALSLNYNVDDEFMMDLIHKTENWKLKSSFIDVLARKGNASDTLLSQWIKWIENERSGMCLVNLVYGASILFQQKKDIIDVLINRFSDLNIPRHKIVINELLLSLLKLSSSCNVIPNMQEILFELKCDSQYFVSMYAKYLENYFKKKGISP